MARVVIPTIPHHVTQRGVRRMETFFDDEDYLLASVRHVERMSLIDGRALGRASAWEKGSRGRSGKVGDRAFQRQMI